MKISKKQITEIIREVLREGETITIPAPTKTPDRVVPDRQTPERKPNPLMPPKTAPIPAPKAMFTEDDITDRIVNRFKSLSESRKKKKLAEVRIILENIISEVSIEQLRQQFVDSDKVTEEVFKEVVRVTKAKGAYATWLLKRVEEETVKVEDIGDWEKFLEIFDKEKKNFKYADIFKYNTEQSVTDFKEEAIALEDKNIKYTGGDKKNAANLVSPNGIQELESVGINFLGVVDGYQCFEVPTSLKGNTQAWKVYTKHLANCAGRDQGAQIRICTMAGQSNFDFYLRTGPYYVFYNLSDPKSPYQFHFESSQFMDKDDRTVVPPVLE